MEEKKEIVIKPEIDDDVKEVINKAEDLFLKGRGFVYSTKLDAYVFNKKKASNVGTGAAIFVPKEFKGRIFKVILLPMDKEEELNI